MGGSLQFFMKHHLFSDYMGGGPPCILPLEVSEKSRCFSYFASAHKSGFVSGNVDSKCWKGGSLQFFTKPHQFMVHGGVPGRARKNSDFLQFVKAHKNLISYLA